jgi:bifunctional N-acetylglucosamine-1-phosphate-uridyltransferase/glucosamine-1-phosphate-acetyltransferase GlmU-like protein
MQYIVTWSMVYEADNHLDAVVQAYGSICDLAENPSVGANYVTVAYDGDHSIKTTIEIDEALALLGRA